MDARIKSGHDERGLRGEVGYLCAHTPTSTFKQPIPDTRSHLAAQCARVVHEFSPHKSEGAGNAGARGTRSLAWCKKHAS